MEAGYDFRGSGELAVDVEIHRAGSDVAAGVAHDVNPDHDVRAGSIGDGRGFIARQQPGEKWVGLSGIGQSSLGEHHQGGETQKQYSSSHCETPPHNKSKQAYDPSCPETRIGLTLARKSESRTKELCFVPARG